MAYANFSTKNADYRLILSDHRIKNEEPIEDLDAIVLEGKFEVKNENLATVNTIKLEDAIKEGKSQYEHIIKATAERGIDLYQVDVASRWDHLFIFEVFLENPFALLFGKSIQKNERYPSWIVDFIGFYNWLIQSNSIELRNAICAKKTEEFIAPTLKEKLGRKPKIGIVYGGMHAGIKLDLKYQRMRDFTLGNHKRFNLKEYFGLANSDIENLNKVEEASFKDGQWIVKKHNLGRIF